MTTLTMNNGLTPQQQDTLTHIINANPKVEDILLFGSRATGNYRINSDIDIALVGEQLTSGDIANILNQIEQSTIPYKVDILITHKIKNKALLEHIQQYGEKWL